MGQTLTHGIYLPDEGERNCYNGLAGNWQLLDGAVGTVAQHTSQIAGKAPAVHTHTKSDITDLLNSNFIPSANDTYDLGSSSYQWNNAYIKSLTINGVACGDILTHNASEFVDVSSDQTIDGVKTFSNEVTMFGRDINLMSRVHYGKNSNPSPGAWHYLYFRGNTATEGYTNAWYSGYLEQFLNAEGSARGRWLVRDTSESTVALELVVNGNDKQVRPFENNTADLGTTNRKWKSLNGVNPGALSLPDYTQYEPINFSRWNTSGALTNIYTPDKNGWLFVNIKDTATNSIYIYAKSITDAQSYSVSVYGNGSQGLAGRLATIIPVIKGLTYGVVIKAASVNDIYAAKFFPALGNV